MSSTSPIGNYNIGHLKHLKDKRPRTVTWFILSIIINMKQCKNENSSEAKKFQEFKFIYFLSS